MCHWIFDFCSDFYRCALPVCVCMRVQILYFVLQFRSNGILDLVNGIACNIIRISCEFDVFAHIWAFSVFFSTISLNIFFLALLLYYSLIIYPFWSRQNEIWKKNRTITALCKRFYAFSMPSLRVNILIYVMLKCAVFVVSTWSTATKN